MRWVIENKGENVRDDSYSEPIITEKLGELLVKLFPHTNQKFEIENCWTGIMGFSFDSFPLIGKLNHPNGIFFFILFFF